MLLLGGAAAAGYFLLSKAHNKVVAAKRLAYTNPKIKVAKLSFSGLELQMTIDFINSSSENISIEYFTGVVQYLGADLSKFTFNGNGQNIVIKARTTTNVPFTVVVKGIGAVTTIAKIVKALSARTGVSTVINVDGIFSAAGFDLPVQFAYDLKTQSLVSGNKKVSGIGKVSTRLEFRNNAEMEEYLIGAQRNYPLAKIRIY